jgi:hypothetical protein
VSDGFKIIFWHGVQNLKAAFLELFSMSRYKEASLQSICSFLAIFTVEYHFLSDMCMIGR